MLRKSLPIILTMLLGFWAADLMAMQIRSDIAAGSDASAMMDHLAMAFRAPLRLSLDRVDLLWGLGGACAVGLYHLYRWSMRRTYRDGEEYGSARWATSDEMAPYTDRNPSQNLQMTATEGLSLDTVGTKRNLNVLMLGSSGARKTSAYVIPNILKRTMHYACTDPKGELWDSTAATLRDAGYDTRCLDLIDLTCDTMFNPLKYIDPMKPDVSIMRLVSNLLANTDSSEAEKHSGDDFWVKSERALLTSLIAMVYYTKVDEKAGECNLNSVVDLAAKLRASEEDENMISEVDAKMLGAEEVWKIFAADEDAWDEQAARTVRGLRFAADQYRPFTQGAGETKKSIIISLGVRLAPLQVHEVREIVKDDNIGIDLIGADKSKRMAIYLKIPDEDTTFNFLAAIFYQCLFDSVFRRTRNMPDKRLPVPLHCFLDEFANVGRIPHFERLISTMRSRNVGASIILQTLGQLKSMYPKDWETITGNCDSTLFYGGGEESTTEWVSKRLGKQTIDTRETSESRGVNGSWSISHRRTGRELMLADELSKMDDDLCIFMLRGLHPFQSRKLGFDQHPTKPRSRLRHSKDWRPIETRLPSD
ncbi:MULTISPECIES: VirD4-like conjugal transfer protein, CD1115 family [Bifidobacterium]|uniref:Conjugal transfer protein TraG n=2 Tax=Bifidobacterium TaxID=1678 RepID=A0A261FNK9_9BIFI|nr:MULTISPECIES: type IV secretory system conjugative DNA transfer family protein [Bifidobacterium]OZG60719.1 conjugal transfer protein TraG [Bifidobacterium lemurum]OZG69617.1 conjugal transfer protein TraG [Bifidobacterium eulemuris]QOL32266.1 type IV secretory system conjugative DNA transfer family protein [Bifidobacterium eulemuris]QOL35226.1 type IV secretory system conjugative DNA transfer family protein [Bifidobacterium lemurum]